MKRFRIALLFFIVSTLLTISVFAAAVPKPVLKANDSVVRIITSYSDGTMASGSGFVVSSDKTNTYIVTNHHVAVLDNPTYISVILNSEAEINASVVASDESRDLAVMKVAMPLGMDPLKLSKESAKKGDGIYVIGFPGDADIFTDNLALNHEDTTITDGIVSALRSVSITGTGKPIDLIQVSAAINHGNSGGPVLDIQGQVVGVSTFTLGATSTDINGAVSVTEVVSFLQESGVPFTLGSGGSQVNPALLAGVFAALAVIAAGVVTLSRRKKKSPKALGTEAGEPMPSKTGYQAGLEITESIRSESLSSLQPQKEKKPWPLKKIIPATIGVCLIILGAGGIMEYSSLQKAIDAGDVNNLNPFFLQIAGMTDKNLQAYVDAVKLLNSGDFEEAEQAFSDLNGYKNCGDMVLECKYRKGKQLIAEQKFEEATSVFEALGEYSDSAEMIKEVSYQQGLLELQNKDFVKAADIFYELAKEPSYKDSSDMVMEVSYQFALDYIEKGSYSPAYIRIKDLAAKGYQKAIDDLPAITEMCYKNAVDFYRSGEVEQAAPLFEKLGTYQESAKYNRLCDIQRNAQLLISGLQFSTDKIDDNIEFLLDNIGFEDASTLVLCSTSYAKKFLQGTWRSADGYYYFKMGAGGTEYNLPEVKNGTYHFDMGNYVVTANGKDYNQFLFQVIDRNTIDVFCYADRYTYTLYRN